MGKTDDACRDNIIGRGTSRQITYRFGKPLKNRPDGFRTGKVLGQLVRHIASIKVRKYQDVGDPRNLALALDFLGGHALAQRRVGLELSIEQRLGTSAASQLQSPLDFLYVVMCGAATRGEGKKGCLETGLKRN